MVPRCIEECMVGCYKIALHGTWVCNAWSWRAPDCIRKFLVQTCCAVVKQFEIWKVSVQPPTEDLYLPKMVSTTPYWQWIFYWGHPLIYMYIYIYIWIICIYIYIHLFGARTLHGFPEKKCGPNFRDEKSAANFPVEPAMVRKLVRR